MAADDADHPVHTRYHRHQFFPVLCAYSVAVSYTHLDVYKRQGTYTVTIKNNEDYHYNSVSFEVPEVDKYAAPVIAVAYNENHTSADITISNPNNAGTIKYTVNGLSLIHIFIEKL